jgi:hypothetical protein
MNYFLLFLFIMIIILSIPKKIEHFKCISNELLKPLNIGTGKIRAFNTKGKNVYIDTNLITTSNNINKIINTIPLKKTNYKYLEYNSYTNNYYNITGYKFNEKKILIQIDNLFNYLKPIFINKSNLFYPKLCNNYTNCDLILQNKKVKVLGYNKVGNQIIEGQILLKFNISSYSFLLDFAISNENNISLHYLKLAGINLLNPYITFNKNSKLKFVQKKDTKIITDQVRKYIKKNRRPDEIYKFSYNCFGRKAVNKGNCENLYYKTNEPKQHIGVWDKKCQKNTECPFYKANKNYENNFGKCNNGSCELPLGAIKVSPRKYRNDSTLMCHNCKSGTDCCNDQNNKKLYPELKSPDYMFLGDHKIRKNL